MNTKLIIKSIVAAVCVTWATADEVNSLRILECPPIQTGKKEIKEIRDDGSYGPDSSWVPLFRTNIVVTRESQRRAELLYSIDWRGSAAADAVPYSPLLCELVISTNNVAILLYERMVNAPQVWLVVLERIGSDHWLVKSRIGLEKFPPPKLDNSGRPDTSILKGYSISFDKDAKLFEVICRDENEKVVMKREVDPVAEEISK